MAVKNLVSKRPPLGKYGTRSKSKPKQNTERDTEDEVSTTMIEVMPQARQAFDHVVNMNDIREEIEEKEAEALRIKPDNAARMADLKMVTLTAMIEIAPTETGI